MNREKTTAILSILLMAALIMSMVFAPRPAEKATGTVGISLGWYASFDAHEGTNGRSAKGSMRTWFGEMLQVSDYDVKYVRVEGNTAWFAAQCTDSWAPSYEGKWLFVKVHDDGTPGAAGDSIGWDWNSGFDEDDVKNRVNTADPTNWWSVIDGNLVIHPYG